MNRIPKSISLFLALLILLTNTVPLLAQSSINLTYDARGNLISDGSQCYEYNGANQMSAVKNCTTDQLIEAYIYDPATGHRLLIEQYQNGQLVNTIFNIDEQYELHVDAATGVEKAYTYVDMPGVRVKNNPDGSRSFSHQDHLGSTNMVTDQAGGLVEETRYYPFGQVLSGGASDRYGFTGQEYDIATGLNFYNSRYYSSQIGVFVQPDSIRPDIYNPQDLNPYTYTRNNPIKYIDPEGHAVILAAVLAVAAIQFAMDADNYVSSGRQFQENPTARNALLHMIDTFALVDPTELGEVVLRGIYEGTSEDNLAAYSRGDIRNQFYIAGGVVAQTLISRQLGKKLDGFVNLASPKRTHHILYGDGSGGGGHKWGINPGSGKDWFPQSWSDDKIMHYISDIATDPNLEWKPDRVYKGNQRYLIQGEREGYKIDVIIEPKGEGIITAYPPKLGQNQ